MVSSSKTLAKDLFRTLHSHALLDWTCLSSTSCRYLVRFSFGGFGGHVNTLNSLSHSTLRHKMFRHNPEGFCSVLFTSPVSGFNVRAWQNKCHHLNWHALCYDMFKMFFLFFFYYLCLKYIFLSKREFWLPTYSIWQSRTDGWYLRELCSPAQKNFNLTDNDLESTLAEKTAHPQ